LYEELE